MANVLAFAETRNGELRKIALEAVTAAREVADNIGGSVDAFVAGAPGSRIDRVSARRSTAPTGSSWWSTPALGKYNPESLASTIAELIKRGGYRVVDLSDVGAGK